MPITYAQLNTVLSELLDDETSQRYLVPNRIAGINSAISRAQTAFGWALANRKGPEEVLRDMTKIGVWQTDAYGAAVLDDVLLGYTVANVLAVYPKPRLSNPDTPILPLGDNTSQFRPGVKWVGASKPAKRVTLEQVPVIENNSMMDGNEVLASNDNRRTWAYFLADGKVWVLPASQMDKQFVAIAHIEKFTPMTDTNSVTNIPDFCTQVLAEWAFEYMTRKTQQNMTAMAQQDAAQLFALMTN